MFEEYVIVDLRRIPVSLWKQTAVSHHLQSNVLSLHFWTLTLVMCKIPTVRLCPVAPGPH